MHVKVSVGSLFDENELNVGSTIDVVTREDWHESSAKDLLGAIDQLPSILPLDNLWGSAVSIRGYTTNLSVRGISYLLDGVSLNNLSDMTSNYDRPFQDLGSLDKIEILRGPGSSVHGSDAFHGVLAVHTFARHYDYSQIKTELGNDGWQQNAAQISQGFNEWRLDASISASDQDARDIQYQYTDPSDGAEKNATRNRGFYSDAAVIKMTGAISQRSNLQLAAYSSQWRQNEGPGGTRGFFDNGLSVGRDRDTVSNDADFSMGKLALSSELKHRINLSFDTYYWQQRMSRKLDFSRVNNTLIQNDKKEQAHGIDVTLKQAAEHNTLNTQWLIRYQHKNARVIQDTFEQTYLSAQTTTRSDTPTDGYRRKTNSLVLQGKTAIWKDKLHVLYGGRWDEYNDVGLHQTPRAGLIYHPAPNSSIKFIYGQAFRAPSANEMLGSAIIEPNLNLDPETIDTYELSYLSHLAKSRLLITFFHSEWNEGIEVRNSRYENKTSNESDGLELSYKGYQGNLTYDFSAAFVESKETDTGIEFAAFPSYMLSFGLGYDWPGENLTVYWSNRVLWDMKAGPQTQSIPEPEELSTYYLSNFNITWRPSRQLETWLDLRNIFDRDNHLPSLWNAENGYAGEPLNLSVGVAFHF